jgi:hypothetical protein
MKREIEEVKERLEESSTKVTVTERQTSTQFTYRIDIPSGSDLDAPDEVRRAIPTSQNIPSNLTVVGNKADGTIRPPNTSKRFVSERELRKGLRDVITADVEILLPSRDKRIRPHIRVSGATTGEYLQTVEETHDNYVNVVLGGG